METQPVILTREDTILALRNDYKELLGIFNPQVVTITREQTRPGTMCLLKFHVKAHTFILDSEYDVTPKPADDIIFYMEVYEGYPDKKPLVYYPVSRKLASVNVYPGGQQCTDKKKSYTSLCSLAEKTIRDIIHDTNVTRYDSMANGRLEQWQRSMEQKGAFPTLQPRFLFADSCRTNLREQSSASHRSGSRAPSLPGKR